MPDRIFPLAECGPFMFFVVLFLVCYGFSLLFFQGGGGLMFFVLFLFVLGVGGGFYALKFSV